MKRENTTGKTVKQSVKNRRLGIRAIALLAVSVVLIAFGILLNQSTRDLLENQNLLYENAIMLREGSQYLTQEVRAYAVTGDAVHYDNYWEEVNTTKSRDIAIATMEEIGITEEESARIKAIGDLSNSLIPLEERQWRL